MIFGLNREQLIWLLIAAACQATILTAFAGLAVVSYMLHIRMLTIDQAMVSAVLSLASMGLAELALRICRRTLRHARSRRYRAR